MIQGTAYLVSIEKDAHVVRLRRFLESRFRRVVLLASDGRSPQDARFGEDDDFRVYFFYPLNAIDTFLGNVQTAVTIGMSNSLDIIGPVAEKQSQAEVAERFQRFRFIVVDSRSLLKYVTASSPKTKVFEVPWGLEHINPELPPLEQRSPRRKILLSRLSSSHYQPELLIRACLQVLALGHKLQFTLIMSEDVELKIKGEGTDLTSKYITIIQPMDEHSFLSILNEFDATLMAPHTDGTSVTMLQAMIQGVVVLSTPSQGSTEWIVHRRTGYLSRGDGLSQVVDLIAEFAAAPEKELTEVKNLAWTTARLFADYQSNMDEVVKELHLPTSQTSDGETSTSA